jgi:hypothetical protein
VAPDQARQAAYEFRFRLSGGEIGCHFRPYGLFSRYHPPAALRDFGLLRNAGGPHSPAFATGLPTILSLTMWRAKHYAILGGFISPPLLQMKRRLQVWAILL